MDTKDLIGQWKLRNGNYVYVYSGKPDSKIRAERIWAGMISVDKIGAFYDENGRHKNDQQFDLVERRRGEERF